MNRKTGVRQEMSAVPGSGGEDERKITRREFLKRLVLWAGGTAGAAFLLGPGASKLSGSEPVWQIDPSLCSACGKCSTSCVKSRSAVRCIRLYAACGYCDLCSGYFRQGTTRLDTAAENQLCPTGAIRRTFVEDPYFEYVVDEELCIACGRCVNGCADFGNGSLYLQIKQDLCLHCGQCEIAVNCPSKAVRRVSAEKPYLLKGEPS